LKRRRSVARKSQWVVAPSEKSKKHIDLYAIVHRRLCVDFHGVRLRGRVVAAGWKTPCVVYRGDKTPLQFIVIAPEGTPTASSTCPTDTIEIGVHSLTWSGIEWEPPLVTD
jgi:hypothetical protein